MKYTHALALLLYSTAAGCRLHPPDTTAEVADADADEPAYDTARPDRSALDGALAPTEIADASAAADAAAAPDLAVAPDRAPARDVAPRDTIAPADLAALPGGDGGFYGASRCTPGQFMFCEDFEADALDPARWTYTGPTTPSATGGYAVIDRSRVARGAHSLHLHSGVQVKARHPEPRLADGFYLRAFMYFAQPIPDHHLNYFYVIDPASVTGGIFTLGSLDGKLGMVEFGPHNGDHAVTGDPLIVGRWFCVEWQVHPATSELRTWVDEVEVPKLHVTDWSPSHFQDFFMELMGRGYDLWVDELAYDTQRIGCRR